jgi:hypothetical protein
MRNWRVYCSLLAAVMLFLGSTTFASGGTKRALSQAEMNDVYGGNCGFICFPEAVITGCPTPGPFPAPVLPAALVPPAPYVLQQIVPVQLAACDERQWFCAINLLPPFCVCTDVAVACANFYGYRYTYVWVNPNKDNDFILVFLIPPPARCPGLRNSCWGM